MQSMFCDTVTLYNQYKEDGAEKWHRTVIEGVFLDVIKGAVARKTGVSSADGVVLIVPMNVPASTDFVAPAAYCGTGWTLAAGDILTAGAVSAEIAVSPKELRRVGEIFTVTSVDRKAHGGSMAHWEVSAK